ncbi:MAG: ABC transporter ATP-binding protein, partial [Kiritimatiellae bacterium]|nr:ABC transporter ATP-binding protein [Kiritimatiellia bacterium]
MLARLFMNPANLLVMDEPTNDLDVETLELLEEQLLSYSGTLLLVSHDREFLDNVVTSTFVLEGDGQVKCYPGGYEDYARQRAAAPQRSAVTPDVAESAPSASPAVAARQKKLSYGESRELAGLPEKIDALEREIAAIQDDLASRRIYESERLAPAQAELESLVERWAELAEREG